ncbi:ABA4-like family protein [Endozoicomonas ascidiicola]|uniref:ABA4-like family protein n=1 Tax=Endozoicomonas ascidiicola TaxID=1698521 RepID=UPI00082977DC|nr:ABA4-like family protein [Endozoicomonas ascidiicola]
MIRLSQLFTGASRVTLLGWFCLVFLPTWHYTSALIFGVVGVLSILYAYAVFLGGHLDEPGEKMSGDFWSLAGVMKLFRSPRAVLSGWVHYLAFDLLVGLFITLDAVRQGVSHWIVIPCLLLTLMYGPAGFITYVALLLIIKGELPAFFGL